MEHLALFLFIVLSKDQKFSMLKSVDFRELYESAPNSKKFSDFKDLYLDDNFNLKSKNRLDKEGLKIDKAVKLFEEMLITYKDSEKGDYQLGTYSVETCDIHTSFTKESLLWNRWHKTNNNLKEI